jgi:hypothetical protein
VVNPTNDPCEAQHGIRGQVGLVWLAGLLVAAGAGVATAHGLFEVALAAGVPRVLAWLYPLITDGLALVAYAATTRLRARGCRYAWTVVVVAAGLSGLTQAGYLAGGVTSAPAVLRFAIGAWPALAAAIVAHLLYLLGAHHPPDVAPTLTRVSTDEPITAPAPVGAPTVAPPPATPTPADVTGVTRRGEAAGSAVHLGRASPCSPQPPTIMIGQTLDTRLDTRGPVGQHVGHPLRVVGAPTGRPDTPPATARALTLAQEHAARHGRLPTVRELATLARVARGTAASALKDLRQHQDSTSPGKPINNLKSPR